MDKKTFIKELERALSVLQEDEMRDIISEYEQHIDMKVQRGLTEEEAIADFGSLPELTAEILKAYHVRADYAADSRKEKKFSFAEGEQAGKEFIQQTGEACQKAGAQTMKGARRLGVWLWGVLLFWKAQIVRPFVWMAGRCKQFMNRPQDARRQRVGNDRADDRRSGMIGNLWSFLTRMVRGCVEFGLAVLCWGIRVMWNLFWIGLALFCGGMGLFCLFGLGMLMVLLIQGYPLAGITIGCLGLNLCLFAAAGFCMTLLWKSQKRNLQEPDASTPVVQEQNTREQTMQEQNVPQMQEMECEQHA